MFFDMELLCRQKQGKFSLIWLAATRGIRTISRKDVDTVNVTHICNEILKYVVSHSTSPKKRLSLYLSAKLLYGTVLLYSQQVTNFEQTIVTFFCTIKRPLVLLDCDDEDKRKKRRTIRVKKSNQPDIIAATQAEQIFAYAQQYEQALPDINANVIDSIHITLPDADIGRVDDRVPDLFGDEGQIDAQLAQLCGDNWRNIPDVPVPEPETITDLQPMNVVNVVPPEIAQEPEPEPTVLPNNLPFPSPDTTQKQQSKRSVNSPEESPSKRKRIAAPNPNLNERISPRADNEEVEMPPPPPPPIRPRRRLNVARNTVNIQVDTPSKWQRTRIDRPLTNVEIVMRSPALRAAQDYDTKELIALILAGVQHDDSDINSIVRGAQDNISTDTVRANLTAVDKDNTLGRTVEAIAEQESHIQEILPTHAMQIENIDFPPVRSPRFSKILNENEEAVNVSDIPLPLPRLYTSTPRPNEVKFETAITRQNDLLERIRMLFLENGNAAIQLEQLCDVQIRPLISTTFCDLLYLHGKQYIRMESVSGTIQLEKIYPGEKLHL